MKIASLRRNAASNVLGWLLPAVIFLFLTPIMIDRLGVDGFGVIALIQVITGYMTFLNFGFSEAITKQVAESAGRAPETAMRVMWVGFGLFILVGLAGGTTLFFLSEWLGSSVLQIPTGMQSDAIVALKISAFVFALQMVAEYYRGVALGGQRFDIPNVSRIVRIALSGIFILVALESGSGLAGVMIATLLGLLIGLVVNAWWMDRAMPLRFVGGPYTAVLHELLHFSKHIFLVRIAGLVSGKASQFLLGTLSSVANVALYEVPVRAAEIGSVILNRILQVFYPGFAAMDRATELKRVKEIFFSVLSIQLLITTPFFLVVILEGEALLAVWVGQQFARGAEEIIFLVAATYYLSSLTNLPTFAAMSFGMPAIVSRYSIIRMAITLVLVYPLVKYQGLLGAAWVLFFSGLPSLGFIYETGRRLFGLNVFRALARPMAIHGLLGISFYVGYESLFRESSLYSPLGVLLIAILYPVLAAALGGTSAADNRRLFRLVMSWR